MKASPITLSRVGAFLGLVVLLLGTAGCTHVQVAPGVQGEYKVGELQVFADNNFDAVYEAARKAMKDVGLFETRNDRKVIEAELNGRAAGDTLVVVKIKEVGRNRTSVKIRYGVLKPDLAGAQNLYQALLKRL